METTIVEKHQYSYSGGNGNIRKFSRYALQHIYPLADDNGYRVYDGYIKVDPDADVGNSTHWYGIEDKPITQVTAADHGLYHYTVSKDSIKEGTRRVTDFLSLRYADRDRSIVLSPEKAGLFTALQNRMTKAGEKFEKLDKKSAVKALKEYRTIRDSAAKHGLTHLEFRATRMMGAAYEQQKDFKNAIRLLMDAVQKGTDICDIYTLALCYNSLGITYKNKALHCTPNSAEQKHYIKFSFDCFEEAMNVQEWHGLEEDLVSTRHSYASLMYVTGQYQIALNNLNWIVERLRNSDNYFMLAKAHFQIANVLHLFESYAQGDHKEAAYEAIRQAQDFASRINHQELLKDITSSKVYKEQQQRILEPA